MKAVLVMDSLCPSICPPVCPSNNLSIHPSSTLLGCLVCVICKSQKFSFLFNQTLHNVCSHIEDVHLLSCAHFMNICSTLGVFDLDIFYPNMLRWCLVCVICNSNSVHFFIFKLCIMSVHTFKMCTSHFTHI